MTNPSGVTMATFEVLEGQVYVLVKGSSVFGQVLSINPQSQISTKKVARLGDTNKSTSYQPAEHSFSLEVYSEKDPNELAMLLGGTTKPGSGGWAGTEQLRLNATVTAYDLKVDVYGSATGSGDVKQGTWHLIGCKPASMNVQIQAENPSTISINGECNDIYYAPAAGIGA